MGNIFKAIAKNILKNKVGYLICGTSTIIIGGICYYKGKVEGQKVQKVQSVIDHDVMNSIASEYNAEREKRDSIIRAQKEIIDNLIEKINNGEKYTSSDKEDEQ